MKYGLLGARLNYSFSKEIHENYLGIKNYEMKSLDEDAFKSFMEKKEFKGINITIPYKKLAMKYCDYIDARAKEIGCVNTVVNKDGKLYGYNTDYYGLKALVENQRVDLSKVTVAILGTGATSNTAEIVAQDLGAFKIVKVSRDETKGITYKSFERFYKDEPIFIVNTTPCGTFPNIDDAAIDLDNFNNVYGVVDVVYNPLRSHLVQQGRELGIPSEGGLRMLIEQAVKANMLFLEKDPKTTTEDIYTKLFKKLENIVFIGMPGCGKTTVSTMFENTLNKMCYHIDSMIEYRLGMTCKHIFDTMGEPTFREEEKTIIKEVAKYQGIIIDCGGGVVLDPQNIFRLKQNGKIYFIYRDIDDLVPTDSRPTALDKTQINARWNERRDLYFEYKDEILFNNDRDFSKVKELLDEITSD